MEVGEDVGVGGVEVAGGGGAPAASLRLGVVSGWYSTKVSGTFVSGPHDTEADCLLKIAEIDPPPAKPVKRRPV